MNKSILRAAGMEAEVDRVEAGDCPMCKKPIHPNRDFRDDLSLQEYRISGMCQSCQDKAYGE